MRSYFTLGSSILAILYSLQFLPEYAFENFLCLDRSMQSSGNEEVLLAEKSRFRAMVEKDLETLDQLISEDLVYIHSNGSVDTKESFISGIKNGSRAYDDIVISESQVRVYGEVGIINAKCTYYRTTAEGRANNLSLFYTSVYARMDGRWQHVSWQSFKLPE